jgi:aspartate-semialdehyde dehydrogenase
VSDRSFRVAIVGATGLVGREVLALLDEREFPIGELRLYGDAESGDGALEVGGRSVAVEPLSDDVPGMDVAFLCEPGHDVLGATLADRGTLVLDASQDPTADGDRPPVLGPADVDADRIREPIRLASPAARLVATPLRAIAEALPLRRVIATVLVPASTFGAAAVEGLGAETIALLNARPRDVDDETPEAESDEAPDDAAEEASAADSLAFRCEPMVAHDPWASGVRLETSRLLGSAISVSIRAVKVPVFYGQAASVSVEVDGSMPIDEIRKRLREAASIVFVEGEGRRTTFDTLGIDAIQVTGFEEDRTSPGWLHFWALAENVRQGAALPAVVIAESLLLRH